MYFEASLHGLKFKASGGLGRGGGGRSPARLKTAGGLGGAQPPPFANRMLA